MSGKDELAHAFPERTPRANTPHARKNRSLRTKYKGLQSENAALSARLAAASKGTTGRVATIHAQLAEEKSRADQLDQQLTAAHTSIAQLKADAVAREVAWKLEREALRRHLDDSTAALSRARNQYSESTRDAERQARQAAAEFQIQLDNEKRIAKDTLAAERDQLLHFTASVELQHKGEREEAAQAAREVQRAHELSRQADKLEIERLTLSRAKLHGHLEPLRKDRDSWQLKYTRAAEELRLVRDQLDNAKQDLRAYRCVSPLPL